MFLRVPDWHELVVVCFCSFIYIYIMVLLVILVSFFLGDLAVLKLLRGPCLGFHSSIGGFGSSKTSKLSKSNII